MKICAVQAMIALTLCGVSMAHANYAQLLDKKITVKLENVPFEKALKKIEQAADVKFGYSINQFRHEETVTITVENQALRDFLPLLFEPRSIRYKVHEKDGTITLKKFERRDDDHSFRLEQDEHEDNIIKDVLQINGTVTDAATKQPMAGVNVVVKGTTRGTTSDENGNFAIEAHDGEVLVFSFIGYAPFELKLSGQTSVEVQLQQDITSLKEVVVNAGYWTVRKDQQTGNIAKVNASDIQHQPVSNPLAALQGRVAGLEVVQSSGLPGGNFTVRIRGRNSVSNGNDPLYIIDGVPYTSTSLSMAETANGLYGGGISPLNSINPSDIESIEVLKDADATAIYGSRGANGVILISTRKGQPGRTKVDFRLNSGVGKVASRMELLTSPEYLEMRREAFINSGTTPTPANAPDLTVWDTTRYTDWQNELLGGTARFSDAQLTISGGDKSTQFFVGSTYHKETTVFPGDNQDSRFSTNVNLSNVSLDQKLKTTVSATYAVNTTNMPKRDLTSLALTLSPVGPPLYRDDGELNWGPEAWNGFGINMHPLSYMNTGFDSRTETLMGNIMVSYSILPNLKVRANAGTTIIGMKAIQTSPIRSIDPVYASVATNSSVFSNSAFRNWISEPQISWQPSIGDGELDALVGASFLEEINDRMAQFASGFSSESLMKNINSADQIFKGSSGYSQYRYHAVFARVNYTFKKKYIINLTGRRDGSSRFGPGKQFSNFGAVGAAWIFSKENFVSKSIGGLSFGKLRGSIGVTGNDQIGDYQYLDTYSPSGSGPYMGSNGLNPQRLYNPNFAWELVRKIEAGLELGFIKDRVTLAASYYRNRSSNQLVGNPLPPTTGFNTIQSNFPAVIQNSGLELELGAIPFESNNFSWNIDINFSLPKNKLVSFPGLETSQYASRFAVGEPLSIAKQYHNTGVNTSTGIYEYEDTNGDNSYTSGDRQTIKFNGRYYYAGVSSGVRYKAFQLDLLFEFVKQNGYDYLLSFFSAPGRQSNFPALVMNRWREEGDVTDIQQFNILGAHQTAYSRLQSSDRAISDASYISLKNISLSWSLPQALLSNLRMEQLKVFMQGQNLFKITNYKGLDPENQSSVLPPLQVMTAGIHLTF